MTPDASQYNPDPQYLLELVLSTGMSRHKLCKQIGMDPRTLRRYLEGTRKYKYAVQFMLESIVLEP